MRRALLLFTAIALLYCGAGLIPGRVLAPVDLVADTGAWKGELTARVRVSNPLLSDVVTQFMAWDAEVLRLVRQGELPWRNRWAGESAPLFANPQTALLSPFTWPRLLFGDAGWALCAILRFVAGALGMAWLARSMGASPNAALLSGFVYAASGYGLLWLLYPLANVFAVFPALAAAALQRRTGLVVLFAALATIGGHPETLFCGVVAIAAFVVWSSGGQAPSPVVSASRRTGEGACPPLVAVAMAALSGFLLCGVVLVPFFRILWASDARVTRVAAEPFGIRWNALAGSILPGYLGSPVAGEIDLTALQRLPENFILRSEAFVGFIVLIALALAWRRLALPFRRGLVIALIGYVLTLRLPGLRLITKLMPLTIEYLTVVFVLFASAAAGPALMDVSAGEREAASRSLLAKALLVAGLLLALGGTLVALPAARPTLTGIARSGIARLQARGALHKPAAVYEARLNGYLAGASTTALHRVLLPGLCWAVAGFGLLTRRRRLVLCAAVVELLAFGLGFNPAVARARVPGLPPPLAQLQRLDPAHEYYAASNLEVFPSNLGTLYGVRDVVAYDSLETRGRVEAMVAAGYDRVTHSFPFTPNPALAPLGVRWLITPTGIVEIAGAQRPAPPRNDPPEGLGWGVGVTIVGAVLALVAMRMKEAER